MKPRTTQWLIGLALALGLFIVLFERGTPSSVQHQREASLLLPRLNPREVRSVEIRSGTNRPVVLERGTNSWFFRAPLLYPAQPASVDRFLERLSQTTYRARVDAGEVARQTNGLAAFGLVPPAVSVVLSEEAARTTLHLGRPSALGGQVYAQLVGQEGLFTTDAGVLGALPASFDAWRDTALVDLARLPFDRLRALPLTNGFEVTRAATNRTWTMTKPLPTRANSARLEHLTQELDLLRVARFVPEASPAELETYGLQPPRRELVFARGTNDLFGLQIGDSPPDETNLVYLRLTSYSNVVLVSRAAVRPWLDGFTNFCDARLMIFEADRVQRIEARVDEAFAVERRTNGGWEIVQPYVAPADPVLVTEALAEMAALEFLGFEREVTTDFTSFGLDPPQRQYVLKAATATEAGLTNPVLAQVDYGQASGHRYFARRSREDSVVLALDPVRLPRAAYRLRDRSLWRLRTNDLAAITVRAQDRTRKLVRTGPMQWAAAEGSGPAPNPVTLEEAAYRLGQLRAERWVAQGEAALPGCGILAGAHEVVLEPKAGEPALPYRIRFGRRAASGRTYAAVTLAEPVGVVVFECPSSIYEFVLSDLTLPPPATADAPTAP